MSRVLAYFAASTLAVSSAALLAQAPAAPQRGGGFALGAGMPPGGPAPQLDKLSLPPGFSIAVYAVNVPGARSMTLGSDGTVFVGTRAQVVHAVVDRNHDFKADEVLTVASGLTSPNGVAFKDGALYVAEINRISRLDGVLDFAKVPGGAGPAPKQTILNDKLPADRMHGWKYLSFGPDGLLYTQIGAPGNILDPEFGKDKSCGDYAPPAFKMGPHVAALGLKFYTGTMFPAEYRKQLFIVNHGSWNRSAQVSHTGYRIMIAKVQGSNVVSYEPFAQGFLQTAEGAAVARQAWGQPVDLLELPDGSLLVSDDRAGAIYRITYRR